MQSSWSSPFESPIAVTRTESSDHERRTVFGHEIPAAKGHIADIDDDGLKGSLQQLGEHTQPGPAQIAAHDDDSLIATGRGSQQHHGSNNPVVPSTEYLEVRPKVRLRRIQSSHVLCQPRWLNSLARTPIVQFRR
jgi:hypothetical protein